MKPTRLLILAAMLIAAGALGQGVTSQTVTIPPAQAYAAFIVPDPGATLTLTINAASSNELVESAVVPSDTGDMDLWSPSNISGAGPHVYTSGTVLSSREWLRIHGKYKPTGGTGGGGGTLPEFDVDVPAADIDIAGVAEDKEESHGGFVLLNDDDDNKNGTADKAENGTVNSENDLLKVTIQKVQSATRFSGTVTLTASTGGDKIKIWKSATKGMQIMLPKTYSTPGDLPKDLWVEGIAASSAAREVELKVSYKTPTGNRTTEDTVKLTVIKTDLNAAYSDQISGRECNALPGQNPMYMGARADNRGYLQIDATVQPQQINNIGMVGVRHGTTILASEPIQRPKTPIDFTPAGSRELYKVVAGCDLNNDGMLQTSEVTDVMTDQLMLLTQGDYNYSRGVLNTGAFFPGVGGDLLDAFIDDALPPGANSTPASITAAALTHPIGAHWTASCDAQTRRYTYAEGSTVSDAVETTGTVEDGLRTNLDQHQTEVQNYFTQNPTVNEHTFGPWTWAINNVEFGVIAHPSLHFAFGHVNIAGTVSVTVRRSDLEVTSIQYTGSFDDIYDFAYNGVYPSIHGATVQAGFQTLGTGGRVFWTRVEFERQTTGFDYDFN
jgi:hypothetical protein